ncbi:hypothetical protein ACHAQJ_006611 [Trichoderma viride]
MADESAGQDEESLGVTFIQKSIDLLGVGQEKIRGTITSWLVPNFRPIFDRGLDQTVAELQDVEFLGISDPLKEQGLYRMFDLETRNLVNYPATSAPYCMLSHRWKGDEIVLQHLLKAKKQNPNLDDVDAVMQWCIKKIEGKRKKINTCAIKELKLPKDTCHVRFLLEKRFMGKDIARKLAKAQGENEKAVIKLRFAHMESQIFNDLIGKMTDDIGRNMSSRLSNNRAEGHSAIQESLREAQENLTSTDEALSNAEFERDQSSPDVHFFDNHRELLKQVDGMIRRLQRWRSAIKIEQSIRKAKEIFDRDPKLPKHQTRYVWLDTCCINKLNHDELSESLSLMGDWYAQSTFTLVHLDTPDSEADAVHHWDEFTKNERPKGLKEEEDEKKLPIKSYGEIEKNKNEWSSRGWTLQELVMSKMTYYVNANWESLSRPVENLGKVYHLIPYMDIYLSPLNLSSATTNDWQSDRLSGTLSESVPWNQAMAAVFAPKSEGPRPNNIGNALLLIQGLESAGFQFPKDMTRETANAEMVQAIFSATKGLLESQEEKQRAKIRHDERLVTINDLEAIANQYGKAAARYRQQLVARKHFKTMTKEHKADITRYHQKLVSRDNLKAIANKHKQAMARYHQQWIAMNNLKAITSKQDRAMTRHHQKLATRNNLEAVARKYKNATARYHQSPTTRNNQKTSGTEDQNQLKGNNEQQSTYLEARRKTNWEVKKTGRAKELNDRYAFFLKLRECFPQVKNSYPIHENGTLEANSKAISTTFTYILWLLVNETKKLVENDRKYIADFGKINSLTSWIKGSQRFGFTTQEVMSLLCNRSTTKTIDEIYCLMGILGVRFHTFPAEGYQKALCRLLDEVITTHNDVSVFNWSGCDKGSQIRGRSMYPSSREAYLNDTNRTHRNNLVLCDKVKDKVTSVTVQYHNIIKLLCNMTKFIKDGHPQRMQVAQIQQIANIIKNSQFNSIETRIIFEDHRTTEIFEVGKMQLDILLINSFIEYIMTYNKQMPNSDTHLGYERNKEDDAHDLAESTSLPTSLTALETTSDSTSRNMQRDQTNTEYPSPLQGTETSRAASSHSYEEPNQEEDTSNFATSATFVPSASSPTMSSTNPSIFSNSESSNIQTESAATEYTSPPRSMITPGYELLARVPASETPLSHFSDDDIFKCLEKWATGSISEEEYGIMYTFFTERDLFRETIRDETEDQDETRENFDKPIFDQESLAMVSPHPIIVTNAGIEGIFDIQRVVITMIDQEVLRQQVHHTISPEQMISGWCTVSTGFARVVVQFTCKSDLLRKQLEVIDEVDFRVLKEQEKLDGKKRGQKVKMGLTSGRTPKTPKKGLLPNKSKRWSKTKKSQKVSMKQKDVHTRYGVTIINEKPEETIQDDKDEEKTVERIIKFIQEDNLQFVAGEWVLARCSGAPHAKWFLCHLELGSTHPFYGHRIACSEIDFANCTPEPGLVRAWEKYMDRKKQEMCKILEFYAGEKKSKATRKVVLEKRMHPGSFTSAQPSPDNQEIINAENSTVEDANRVTAPIGRHPNASNRTLEDENFNYGEIMGAETLTVENVNPEAQALIDNGDSNSNEQLDRQKNDQGGGDAEQDDFWYGLPFMDKFFRWRAEHLEKHLSSNVLNETPENLRSAIENLNDNRDFLPAMFHSAKKVHMF